MKCRERRSPRGMLEAHPMPGDCRAGRFRVTVPHFQVLPPERNHAIMFSTSEEVAITSGSLLLVSGS